MQRFMALVLSTLAMVHSQDPSGANHEQKIHKGSHVITVAYVDIRGEVNGLNKHVPPGEVYNFHGTHIHEFGDLSDKEAGKSAGPHYNPTNQEHGCYPIPQRKCGDLGNIVVTPYGARIAQDDNVLVRLSGTHSVIGRSIIVHLRPDNCEATAAGDASAGPRIGMCVIGQTKPGSEKLSSWAMSEKEIMQIP